MHRTCKSSRHLDKLVENIPKPRGAVPDFGLPKWKLMPLESKIPMVPGPEGAYNFTRQKIGKNVWVSSKNTEFNLNDPYCYEMKVTYDPLHDEHLTSFFTKPHNIRRLLEAGLVTKDLSVKCSLRDYNVYRAFLRKLHCDSVRKELKRRTYAFNEKRRKNPPYQAKIEANRLRRAERKKAFKKARERILLEKEERVKQLREKADRMNERLREAETAKENRLQSLHENKAARYEHIRQKLKTAVYLERLRVVRTLTRWKKKERKWKKERELRAVQNAEEKRKTIEDKWAVRQTSQKEQIEKETFLLQCIRNEQEKFLKEYGEKVDKERERMKKLFEKTKTFITCYLARQVPNKRKRVCCKVLKRDKQLDPEEEIRRLLCGPRPKLTDAQRRRLNEAKRKKAQKQQRQEHGDHRKKTKSKKQKRSSRAKEAGKLDADSQVEKDDELDTTSTIRQQSESPEPSTTLQDKCRCEMIKARK